MGDAASLIKKYKGRGALFDTNLLVLLLVGSINERRIPEFKRTQDYSIADFRTLKRLVQWFGTLSVTPHVLSQVSDLTKLSGREFDMVREQFREFVVSAEECSYSARELVHHPLFARFGLADASVSAACEQNRLVLTADLDLYIALTSRGLDAMNFRHVRALAW